MNTGITIYLSDRGIPLIFNGSPHAFTNVLTVEAYPKWYNVFVVNSEGKVSRLPSKYVRQYEKGGVTAISDHIPSPWFAKWLVDTYKEIEWDPTSYDCVIGRWVSERRGNIPEEVLL